ncbi:hypothetical protein V8D89_006133 [Ganoderma adspersum]
MRLSLTFVASVLAAAGLVGANPVEIRAGHHTIEVPAAGASIKSPFTFKFSDTTRNKGDSSHLQLSFYDLTHRYTVGSVSFSKSAYTEASALVHVPSSIPNGPYDIVVQEINGDGTQLYEGTVEVHFTR